jgi:hypothetical protein
LVNVGVPEIELSKEQCYFVSGVIARLNTPDEFCKFVVELCRKRMNKLDNELLFKKSSGMDEKVRAGKIEYSNVCHDVIRQLNDHTAAVEFSSEHKVVIAAVLNLMIIVRTRSGYETFT